MTDKPDGSTNVTKAEYPPLCFVLMPFGVKSDSSGRAVDFDRIYFELFRPAVLNAGMEPLRADEERDGGMIHKPMFERLVLCPFALADLTLANANVFYELGVRHAVRPHTTVLAFEQGGQRLPFDVAPLRALPYSVDSTGFPTNPDELVRTITERLDNARNPANDSPLYQLLDGISPPDIARIKTDVFRERAHYNAEIKQELFVARSNSDANAMRQIEERLEPLGDNEAGVLVDLMLSFRDVKDYEGMLRVSQSMPTPVARSALVREQRALALNRLTRRSEAEQLLKELIAEQGPSSETLGILGRVYKDRWDEAVKKDQTAEAAAHMRKAIGAYRDGFEADWRDAYPGVNLVTLLVIQGDELNELPSLVPVVRYAVQRRLEIDSSDYWDHASMLELSVIENDRERATQELGECLSLGVARWQRETTANNLRFISSMRNERGEDPSFIDELTAQLLAAP